MGRKKRCGYGRIPGEVRDLEICQYTGWSSRCKGRTSGLIRGSRAAWFKLLPVRIRGYLHNNSDPLCVVDGLPSMWEG